MEKVIELKRQQLQGIARSVLFVRHGSDQVTARSVYSSAERFPKKSVLTRTGCIPSHPQSFLSKLVQTLFGRQIAHLRSDKCFCEKNSNFLNGVFLRRFRADGVVHGGTPVVEDQKSTLGGAA